jgi:hypothetical protein
MRRKIRKSVHRWWAWLRPGDPERRISDEGARKRHISTVQTAPRRRKPKSSKSEEELLNYYRVASSSAPNVVMRSAYSEEAHKVWLRMQDPGRGYRP